MDSLILFTARVLPYLLVAAAVVVWLLLPRRDKVALVVQGVVTLVVVLVLIQIAGAVHTDPRPFVADPSVQPLFPHEPDNGFPSNHTSLAVAVALLVVVYRRWVGGVLFVLALCVGAARVAAHVHHVQDIVGGAVIGLVSVLVALLVWRLVRGQVLGWAERLHLVPPGPPERSADGPSANRLGGVGGPD